MRKKGMRFLSLLMTFVLLISSVFCFPLSASAATIGKTTAYVNLRTGAGTGYSIIETIPQGAQITITDTSNKSWYRITAPSGKSGYMCSDYIQIIGESSDSGSISGVKYSARTTAYVNLRRGAGTNYSSILVVPQGATITVLAKTTSSWYQVQYGSYVGYMYAQYIQITGTIGTATATPKPTATPTAKPSTTPTATPKPTATPNPAAAQTGKTTAYVNLRSGAGTGYSIYLTVPQGATITVLDTSNPNWYKVKYSSYTGYMSSQYIQIQKAATPTPAPTPTPKPIGTAKTTAALNIRKGPGTSYASLGVLPSGATVTVIEKCSNGWYRVKTAANVYGYCSGDYLKVTLGTATPTPKPTATPTPKPTTAPVTGISESEAYARLTALQSKYPTGKYWNHVGTGLSYSNNNMDSIVTANPCNHARDGRANCNIHMGITNYMWVERTQANSSQCFGFASMLSDAVFGKNAPITMHTSYDKLKVGDNIRLTTYGHSLIVLTKTSTYITVAECNADFSTCVLSWGRKITKQDLESYNRIYMTRYPDVQSDGTAAVGETTTAVNIRSGPGTENRILTTASSGTRISIISKQNKDWYLVQTLGGTLGYMSSEYIKIIFSA